MCQVLKVGSCAEHEAQSFGRGIYTLALGEEYYPQQKIWMTSHLLVMM
jgi:hypothetical protein